MGQPVQGVVFVCRPRTLLHVSSTISQSGGNQRPAILLSLGAYALGRPARAAAQICCKEGGCDVMIWCGPMFVVVCCGVQTL